MEINSMDKLFLVNGDNQYSYRDLIHEINQKDTCYRYLYVKDNDPYQVFLSIIHSLAFDYPIEVLDGDFSANELEEIGVDKRKLYEQEKVNQNIKLNDISELANRFTKANNWSLTLYTSGTTGRPKKVTHSLKTLARNVKQHEKFKNNVWAFAYNPTHMAGLQVFFQAIYNFNTIVYAFGSEMRNLPELIWKYSVTNISATSTYYRNVIPYLKSKTYNSVNRITFGGEKYDPHLESTLSLIFPKAKIRNIYASTEAGSLFTAKGDIFEVEKTISHLIKINENQELLVHKSQLGSSESFSYNEDEWFNTGDLVEQVGENQFKFLSRKSDLINVGGYKVNPTEVENVLLKVPGVVDLIIKSKENKVTGQILVLDVIKEETVDEKDLKKSIKQYASSHLQEWKVPRIIKIVDEIPKTRTGKKVRK